jgi:hypothetical protein
MTAIGIFVIGHFISSQVLGYRRFRGPPIWQKLIAVVRYLSYRGFYVKALGWNSAPIGLLLLGAIGAIYFFCKLHILIQYEEINTNAMARQVWT